LTISNYYIATLPGKRPAQAEISTSSVTRPQKVFAADAKWLFDQGLTVQRRLFGEGVDHPVTASLLFAKGECLLLS
jgi:hypothetical protein